MLSMYASLCVIGIKNVQMVLDHAVVCCGSTEARTDSLYFTPPGQKAMRAALVFLRN